ncbi:MAG: hypothetical protein KC983_06055 [Phycisphaerales bacterium]|nr:hypothetical protein [Phycisphaerales bacterium]
MPRSTVRPRKHTPVPLDITHFVPSVDALANRRIQLESQRCAYLDLLKACLTASHLPSRTVCAPRTFGERMRCALRDMPIIRRTRSRDDDLRALRYTSIARPQLDHLQMCVETIVRDRIAGDIIETGVARGGTLMLMLAVLHQLHCSDRRIWACDVFNGTTADTVMDIQAAIDRFDLRRDVPVTFVEGAWDAPVRTIPIESIALLRLDTTTYEQTLHALESLYSRLNAGGIVIVSRFGVSEACRRAVTDFRAARSITDPLQSCDDVRTAGSTDVTTGPDGDASGSDAVSSISSVTWRA